MEKLRAFQYLIILHPTEEEWKKGQKSQFIIPKSSNGYVATVLAANEQGALVQAAWNIPERFTEFYDRIEVAVRPF